MGANNSVRQRLAIAVGALMCVAWTSLPAAGKSGPDLSHKRVLLLFSYHPTFVSSDAILHGVRSVLDKHGLTLDIEFMDSKRVLDDVSKDNFLRLLSYKLAKRQPYDLVMLSDDNALNFALDNRAQLFPKVPMVFLAVNDAHRAIEMDDHPSITGVVEALSYQRTIDLMQSLQRPLKKIVAVVDTTPSGEADRSTFDRLSRLYPDIDFEVLSLGDLSWEQLARQLAHLGPNTAVLRLAAFRDSKGKVLDKQHALALMTESSSAPVYVLRENALHTGALGGVVLSHREQGRQAALMVEKVLQGVPVSSIKVMRQSPNRLMFDYAALKRLGISPSSLPAGSIVVNTPFSLAKQYAGLIAVVLAVVIFLIGFSAYLMWQIRARKRAELTVQVSKKRYKTIFQSAGVSLWEEDFSRVQTALDDLKSQGIEDIRGYLDDHPEFVGNALRHIDILNVNEASLKLFGAKNKQQLLGSLEALFLPESLTAFKEELIAIANGERFFESEVSLQTLQGQHMNMLMTLVIPGQEGDFVKALVSFTDITQRKQVEEALRESEEHFRNLIEGSIEGILIDRSRKPLFANQSFADMLGYESAAEITTMESMDACVAPHERERLTRYTEARMKGEPAPSQYEYEALRKDGSTVILQNLVRTIHWQGEPAIQSTVINISDRKQAEAQLRHSEARLAETQRIALLGSWDWNVVTDDIDWSDVVYRIFAIQPEEFDGTYETFLDFVHPDDREMVMESVDKALYQQQPYDLKHRITLPTGEVRVVHERAEITLDEAGKHMRMLGTVQDITERERIEGALRESKERFRDVADAASDWIWEMGPDLRFTYVSGRIKEVTGTSPAYLVGKTRKEVMSETAHSEAGTRHLDDLEAQRSFRDFVYEAKLEKGKRHLKISGKPIFDADGIFQGYRGTGTDITEQKRAEAALGASERRYRVLYDDNPSMYFTVGPDGTILSVNPFGAQQLGYTEQQLTGTSLLALVHNHDRQKVRRLLDEVIQKPNRLHRWEARRIRQDGSVLWARETARVTEDVDCKQVILVVCEDITEAHKLAEEISYQATHDSLTGLVNRREFEKRLTRILQGAGEDTLEHALCYLDLDQFKVINDICGHIAGDELLRRLGKILRDKVRKRDTLARLGGDEFGVLLEDCSLEQAERIAEGLQKAIRDFRFAWDEKVFAVGVSIGLVPIGRPSESVTSVLSMADAACYAAKDAGRNRIHVYHESDTELARRHGEMQLVSRINHALEENRFHLVYQPIIPISDADDKRQHFELLIRMQDETGGTISPTVFLAAAERYNLSVALDRWVISTAFEWLTDQTHHLDHIHLCSINLSGHSLGDSEFLEFVIGQFSDKGVPPEKVCFEITETAAIANFDSATRLINTLRARGCRFALDDFGSGLSSFAYLKNLPVDFLKIDGMFVKDIVDDPIALAMVKSINEIGQVMGKQTIAEFVENDAILERLREISIDYAQGFGVGRPRPLAEMMSPPPLSIAG
jgi:diguanylate cyclase (GGDEF)-like protein/PAS domain S-box-containing protein